MFDKLRKSIVDAVQEGQLKLGYRSETIRLYYPLASLCLLTEKEMSAEDMTAALEKFAGENERELGRIEVSRKGERFCLAVPPQGAQWVHEHTNPNGFLADFIRTIGRPWLHDGGIAGAVSQALRPCAGGKSCTTGSLTGSSSLRTANRMNIATASPTRAGHLTYHRFTREDYEAFGF